ncbi:MAG: FAD-dependent oxidoreductase [Pseudonocardia sp.]|uniref:FAD-dependent oxidoreductase n=1 Tax=unclassified Pseudonocardia TaxID=2619320 RepID=UPI000869750A|nr:MULTISPECIES: FAD-dependent oxidoreductase [unclassified Pseudonocardia]MBN9108268.1 FAD-dependent oxidoreductase [Pseudonocardia sp.]ODU25628.1 MAG: fumarate reductase [Pseudonocardia sp. SCN 72-51]ODV08661.1 MAG: fumarate reductase [Pseudonocardia sp. SCN 73-27]
MSESRPAEVDVDVVVVGAGGGGLAAALAAVDAGASAVVLEKEERAGGNSALSTGSVPGAGTRWQAEAGIDDSPARLAADLLRQSGPHDAEETVEVLAAASAGLVEWLVDSHDIDLRLITDYKHVGHSVPRLHAPPSRKGHALIADMLRAAKAADVEVLTHSPVDSLVVEDGVVRGVVVSGARSGTYTLRCRAVVLAANGFGADPAMVSRFAPEASGLEYLGAHGSTGEAVGWLLDLGATMGNASAFQGYAAVASPHGSITSWTTVEHGGIVVDAKGERIGDESTGYSGFAANVSRAAGPVHVIFDAPIRDSVAAHEEEFAELVAANGTKEAPDAASLAAAIGADPAVLARTLDEAAAAAAGDAPDPAGRTAWGRGPLQRPYVAVRAVPALFHTQGGVQIDAHARVVGPNGPIPGVYATGGVAAGVSGRAGGAGYSSGNGLLTALGLGMIAGRHAASQS